MFYVKVSGANRPFAAHTESRDHAEQMFDVAVAVLRSSPESTTMVELLTIEGQTISEAYLTRDKLRIAKYEDL
jgi:hypothetical protein